MQVLYDILDKILARYDILATIIAVFFILYAIYNRIKYLCLKKASEMVAKVEADKELTGEEKFALCIVWISEELPKVFKNSIFQTILEKIIQHAYDTSFEYATNYIERKTGTDISTINNILQNSQTGEENSDNIEQTKDEEE